MDTELTSRERRVLRALMAERPTEADKQVVWAVIIAAARKGDRGAQRWLEKRNIAWRPVPEARRPRRSRPREA